MSIVTTGILSYFIISLLIFYSTLAIDELFELNIVGYDVFNFLWGCIVWPLLIFCILFDLVSSTGEKLRECIKNRKLLKQKRH